MIGELNIWFSRHQPSIEQVQEISGEIILLKELAEITITDDNLIDFLNEFFSKIYTLANDYDRVHINLYGVVPPVLRSILLAVSDLTNKQNYKILIFTLESWNIMRSKEGEKPSFQHKKFVCTGYYYLPSSPNFINSIISAYVD